ncbi:hypothetical protein CR513_03525, partial [Mucuna pruriens]
MDKIHRPSSLSILKLPRSFVLNTRTLSLKLGIKCQKGTITLDQVKDDFVVFNTDIVFGKLKLVIQGNRNNKFFHVQTRNMRCRNKNCSLKILSGISCTDKETLQPEEFSSFKAFLYY